MSAGDDRDRDDGRGDDDPGDHVQLVDMPVRGLRALYASTGDDWVVLVDRRLAPTERDAAVAHELVHHERGGGSHHPGMPDGWRAVVRREERTVDRIALARVVPLAEVRRLARAGEPVDADDVARELDLPVEIARRALEAVRDESSTPRPVPPPR